MSSFVSESSNFVLPVLAYVTLGFAVLGYQLKAAQPSKKLAPIRIRSRK